MNEIADAIKRVKYEQEDIKNTQQATGAGIVIGFIVAVLCIPFALLGAPLCYGALHMQEFIRAGSHLYNPYISVVHHWLGITFPDGVTFFSSVWLSMRLLFAIVVHTFWLVLGVFVFHIILRLIFSYGDGRRFDIARTRKFTRTIWASAVLGLIAFILGYNGLVWAHSVIAPLPAAKPMSAEAKAAYDLSYAELLNLNLKCKVEITGDVMALSPLRGELTKEEKDALRAQAVHYYELVRKTEILLGSTEADAKFRIRCQGIIVWSD